MLQNIKVWTISKKWTQIITIANEIEHGKNSCSKGVCCFNFFVLRHSLFVSNIRFWPHTYERFQPKMFYLIAAHFSFFSLAAHIRNPKLISSFKRRCCKSLKLTHKYFRTQIFNVLSLPNQQIRILCTIVAK